MKSKFRSLFPAAGAAILATLTLTVPTLAADQTWNPDGPNDYWSTLTGDENWNPGGIWTPDNNAIFGGTAGETVFLGENVGATNLTFGTAGYAINGAGFTLTLANGSVIQTDADAAINALLAGNGFTKTGPGILTLGGANGTVTGTVTVSQGRLRLDTNTALAPTVNLVIGDANSGANAPNLYLGNQLNPAFATLTVGTGITGATVHTGGWAPAVSGLTTLHSALTVQQYNGGGVHTGIQTSDKITGPGAGSGNDSLILRYGGSQNFYWQANSATANDFLGNVRATGSPGNVNIQGANNGPNNTIIPDSAMLTIDAGINFRWNNFTTQNVLETIDGLAGPGTMSRNLPTYTLTINANNPDNEGDRVFRGNLSGMSGVLTLGGTGTQEFMGSSPNFTNATALDNGTLKLTNTTAWGSAIAFGAANAPVLQLHAPEATDAWTFAKPITGTNTAARVTKTGAGTRDPYPAPKLQGRHGGQWRQAASREQPAAHRHAGH